MCPGSLFPPQLAAEAAHHHCMLVDRGPYSRTGTADEIDQTADDLGSFIVRSQTNSHNCMIISMMEISDNQFAVLSHFQDVAEVVFRKGALCPGTGLFILDVDVLPIQTQRMSLNN